MSDVLSVSDLRKAYGSTVAVDEVSFTIGRNEIVGLLGPNGAGKTTTIDMILGVLEPTAGYIEIDGIDLKAHRSQAIELTNFAAVYAPVPGNLTVYQNLRFFGMIYGVKDLKQRIDELLERFDLTRFRDVKAGVLSSGEQARAGLAKAFLNRPRLLLLDEPTAALDPKSESQMIDFLVSCSGGRKTVVTATHDLDLVEDIADYCHVFQRGRIVAEGTPAEILNDEALLLGTNLIHAHRHAHRSGEIHSHPHRHGHGH